MRIHQVQPKKTSKKRKRVGRGGKRGTYSGKGIKGQKSRAGHKIRPAERDLIQRLPKLRGVKNKRSVSKPRPINVSDLGKFVEDGVLNKKKLGNIKILGKGEVTKPFRVIGIPVSKQAEEKIRAAGGKIE